MQKTKILLNILVLLLSALPVAALAQTSGKVTVSGIVTAASDNEPLIGVNVVAGPTVGVTTGIDGDYQITVDAGTTLKFQFIGYKVAEFLVPAGTSKLTYNLALQEDAQQVEEVVVVAYGVRKKGTVTGSVATVQSKEIANVPAASFDQALQGRTPGMTVLSNSGEPSAPAQFQIRGVNSINSGTEPLFILDGVPITANDFSAINPSDIENISMLKDASSTSIYGARAANGVVVVTSKRGKIDTHAKVTFRTQIGFSQLAFGNWNIMNTAERIAYEKEIGMDAGKNYDELSKINIDWRKAVFTDNAPLRNYEVAVSGASSVFNYYVSGGYYRQKGIAISSDFERYSFRANLEAQAKEWLKIGTNTMLSFEKTQEADEGDYTMVTPISASRFMLPYVSPYKPDGSLASVNDGSWLGMNENPLEWALNNPLKRERYKVISSTFAEVKFIDGLTFRSALGLNFQYRPTFTTSTPSYAPNNGMGTVGRGASHSMNLTSTNTLNYMFDINGEHSFNFLLGHEFVDNDALGFSVITIGQNNDKLQMLSTGTRAASWNDTSSASADLSFFTRGEYNYKRRYFVEFSARREASSRFGKQSRWGTFWSVGAMWDLRNERFMHNVDWLTNAQLSLSTGTTGNSSIPDYEHFALVTGGPIYDHTGGIAPSSPGNEDLTWEETWATNLSLKLGFWNRVDLSVEFYNKKTTDMLMAVPTSFTTGFGYKWSNVGSMVNRGVELSLNADVIRSENFVWNIFANASYNKNEITELFNGNDQFEISNTGILLQVGHPFGEFYLNRYAGVNPANGDALWYTRDGELTTQINESDKVMVGKSWMAPWQGGFGTSVSWKGFTVSALFSWVADRYMLNNDRYFDESNGTFQSYNQSNRLLYERWKKPGDVTDIPRHGVPTYLDTHLLEDASFLRLKNLTISYNLPQSWLKKTRFFQAARLYLQGQNLCTWTKFSGLDPEGTSNMYAAQYPMSRQFTFGVEITF